MRLFRGVAYRVHRPEWAMDPTSGLGAQTHGGRFNRPGVAALYLALTRDGAFREANQGFRLKEPPSTIVSYDVDCDNLVDLRSPLVRREWAVTLPDLRSAWVAQPETPPTWELADRLIAAGHAGILVRSFAPGAPATDTNLVLWTWGPKVPHKVVPYDPEGRLGRIRRHED